MPADPNIEKDLDNERWKTVWDKHANLRTSCVKVSNFLSEGAESTLFTQSLKKLEAELAGNQDQKMRMGSLLRRSEATWGVNVAGDDSVQVTALRSLSPDEFGSHLSKATLIKDPGAGTTHGEYTHRIQWYLINAAKCLTPDDANTLLRAMGDKVFLAERKNDNQVANGLWDCLFDRLTRSQRRSFYAVNNKDFRCPEYFNSWMTEQGDQFPFLSEYLSNRTNKRDRESITNNQFIKDQLIPVNDRIGEVKKKPEFKKCAEVYDQITSIEDRQESFRLMLAAVRYTLKKLGKDKNTASDQQVSDAVINFQNQGSISSVKAQPVNSDAADSVLKI